MASKHPVLAEINQRNRTGINCVVQLLYKSSLKENSKNYKTIKLSSVKLALPFKGFGNSTPVTFISSLRQSNHNSYRVDQQPPGNNYRVDYQPPGNRSCIISLRAYIRFLAFLVY